MIILHHVPTGPCPACGAPIVSVEIGARTHAHGGREERVFYDCRGYTSFSPNSGMTTVGVCPRSKEGEKLDQKNRVKRVLTDLHNNFYRSHPALRKLLEEKILEVARGLGIEPE